jgi:hypothetical protein
MCCTHSTTSGHGLKSLHRGASQLQALYASAVTTFARLTAKWSTLRKLASICLQQPAYARSCTLVDLPQTVDSTAFISLAPEPVQALYRYILEYT